MGDKKPKQEESGGGFLSRSGMGTEKPTAQPEEKKSGPPSFTRGPRKEEKTEDNSGFGFRN